MEGLHPGPMFPAKDRIMLTTSPMALMVQFRMASTYTLAPAKVSVRAADSRVIRQAIATERTKDFFMFAVTQSSFEARKSCSPASTGNGFGCKEKATSNHAS